MKTINRIDIVFTLIIVSLLVCCKPEKDKSIKNNTTNNESIKNDYGALNRNYPIYIDSIMQSSLNRLSSTYIEKIIPRNSKEFIIYYSYTFPDKPDSIRRKFFKIDDEIAKNAVNNKGNSLFLYLELSSYVDGEYAEAYFENVDFIIGQNTDEFCALYSKLSNSSKEKLNDFFLEYCNK